MATKKNESETRLSYKVLRAFVHEGTYYAGQDVPEIGELPKPVINDRIERGYIKEFRAHVQSPEPVTPVAPEA
jgi:hypothetical protein